MSIINSQIFPPLLTSNQPLIGYQTVVAGSGVFATTELDGFPASNVANAATHQAWISDPSESPFEDQYLTLTFPGPRLLNYIALARHNLAQSTVSIEAIDEATRLLLHMNGTDGSTDFPDSIPVGHSFTANGDVQVDTAESVFGGASALFDGTGDYLTTPDSPDFDLADHNFTVECWAQFNDNGTFRGLAGQGDGGFTAAASAFRLRRRSDNTIEGSVSDGTNIVSVTSATTLTNDNQFHHIAFVRQADTLGLFIDGIQEDSNSFSATVNNSDEDFSIGARSSGGADPMLGWIDEFRLSVGVARYEPSGVGDNLTRILMHFDGSDGSTTFTDEVGHSFSGGGNAQLDTADQQFGSASLLCDGSGDFISASDSSDFTLGSQDFTVEAWVKFNDEGFFHAIAGHGDTSVGNTAFELRRRDFDNVMQARVSDGTNFVFVNGSTPLSNVQNPGWHHVALVRAGDTLLLFVDGVQEAAETFTGSVVDSSENFFIGARAFVGGTAISSMDGWIDEFRLSIGIARYTSNFTPSGPFVIPPGGGGSFVVPTSPFSSGFEIVQQTPLGNNSPIIFRFAQQLVGAVRVRIQPGTSNPPAIAVAFAGLILVIQRRIYVGHGPANLNSETQILTGRSERGVYLGRVERNTFRATSVEIPNLTATWVRDNFAEFIETVKAEPFFFAWRPATYPDEVVFCWTRGDVKVTNDLPNGMMRASFDIQGVAE